MDGSHGSARRKQCARRKSARGASSPPAPAAASRFFRRVQSVHYHPVRALVAPPAERRACCSPPPIWWHRSHLWRFGERRIAEFVWQSRLSSPLFSARCRVLLPSPAAMFLRHTQLFLWKNSLQKARNPGQTSCELLTPVLLVALFALLCVGAPRRVPCCVCRCARRGGGRRGHPLPRRRLPFAGSSTPT